ncbi:MAG: adenylyltransferase/cytidyltransferase family protein [Candidatus Heimdallarchaeaceae archaeon]
MVGIEEKRIIRQLYVNNLKGINSNLSILMRQLEMSTTLLDSFVSSLLKTESLTIDSEHIIRLTQFGRKQISVVLTGGTYDILHIGHLFTLEQARLLGNALVVVLATDKNVERLKNRLPTHSMDDRAQILENVKTVDAVIKGSETDFMSTVDFIDPDIIALGYDQAEEEKSLYESVSARGHSHVKIIRLQKYVPGKSTTKIMQDIIKHNYRV